MDETAWTCLIDVDFPWFSPCFISSLLGLAFREAAKKIKNKSKASWLQASCRAAPSLTSTYLVGTAVRPLLEIGYWYNLAQLDLTKLFKIKIWLVLSKATFLLSCRTLTLILQYDEVITSALAGDVHGHGDRAEWQVKGEVEEVDVAWYCTEWWGKLLTLDWKIVSMEVECIKEKFSCFKVCHCIRMATVKNMRNMYLRIHWTPDSSAILLKPAIPVTYVRTCAITTISKRGKPSAPGPASAFAQAGLGGTQTSANFYICLLFGIFLVFFGAFVDGFFDV